MTNYLPYDWACESGYWVGGPHDTYESRYYA